MSLDTHTIARKKRTRTAPDTETLSFEIGTVYKMIIDRVTYFVTPKANAQRDMRADIIESIQHFKKKQPDMAAITRMTFSVENDLRRPVPVKILGEAPKRLSGVIMMSPYHLLIEADRKEVIRLINDPEILDRLRHPDAGEQ